MTHALPPRSQLRRLTNSDAFWWSTGIEDTFITAPHPVTGRTLDEYELTGHYERWREDLGFVAELGVPCARYGVPWHRIQPERSVWDWTFPDEALGRLLELGVDPQVDLVHYGLPAWIENAFLHPDYPKFVAEYAARLAERFKGRITWYTPLNEPRITGWYCGRLGWWPPFRRSWSGFVALMLAIARGMVETVRALESVDPEIVPYFVDATDLFDTDEPEFQDEARHRQEIVFLALDLVSGRIDESHLLWPWLLKHGARESELKWFLDNSVEVPVIGMNLYPMFTQKKLVRDSGGRFRIRMPYAGADLITRLGRLYYERYRVPLTISETASIGSLRRRLDWLDRSVAATRELREEGVPLVGYTWWPTFALVTWAYRQGRRPVTEHLAQMGLWDIVPDEADPLRRVRTSAVDSYQHLVRGGVNAVGNLSQAPARAVAG
ncbi:glycoside hydrolase [Microvirga ossetica]|uniref:Glycoside hydrolase n=1 Tax=Microvirga ossetica TaxID=1882682 RepID=A0A1B2EM65_9HYPH|nr:family 1 glycosylhydrolase [Microvirga ossetica]ANY81073.1 glycoside hydrolase [Microvirga ossetica]